MYKNILFASDLNDNHFEMSERAAGIARLLGAKLYLLHVIELPASMQLAQGLGFTELASPSTEDARTVLGLLGDALDIPRENQFVEIGSPGEHIEKKAKALDCQMVIIGSHSSESLSAWHGGLATALGHHSGCDVLILGLKPGT